MKITSKAFGNLPNGTQAELFTLSNDAGVVIQITNYGAIITSVETPDKNGETSNIVCGFEKLEDYLSEDYLGNYPYFGALIGRNGNRIAGGKYTIDGVEYTGAINNGPNHLHGGLEGFDKKLWQAETFTNENEVGLKLSYTSVDGEEGYPGTLKTTCIYTLNNQNELGIKYEAETDKKTLINLTNHSYFNLTGGKEDIKNHELQLAANKMTESVDLIPTGQIVPVEGTPYDFTSTKKLAQDLGQLPEGYDLNYVLDNEEGKLVFAGRLQEATSGRQVEVYTTQPGMQVYTGYWIPELTIGGEKKFGSYAGVALETQHYPDAPHHANFPSTVLAPNEKYEQQTIYKFGVSQ
ncbi:aldose epimerase family protein [uncultured Sunxiuqinia sp.]|uniref:aldose epimerase family protein n=1 Tax=uncultured Sunxiuqinia sp. TaxID=1573825 RepID=UPI002618C207|nr:aldose epimerase family protein [uncultured Sunxiuqinia sp.]